ncbi:ABC transporter substrate-binding protein [Actinosynnema mirum]|uniref:Extracellular solute-binding protein family 5 n=1 Tax=Actinosynnema mirum (strain ATCC 29888 / DSM 43827 / JCM 3225 / NBRC 14064 / NCIMB 13271 / NRRL B-12336 / IMRU 3971 / 101) TaxID=446462 RepID=C6WAP1_ACTMD|nr:extracellular solute-binding protein family 5 [Actinosynnema mirum DSM 43827]
MGVWQRIVAASAAAGLSVLPFGVPAQAQNEVVLRVAITQQVDSLNPFLATFQASTEVGRLMYDFLTAYDQRDQTPVPALADRWSSSEDRLTWTFHVPEGRKWSDGQDITADDVAFTYDLMMRDTTAATANGSFTADFESVTASADGREVVIRTKQPQATMLALDVPIVPEHVWSEVTDVGDYTNDQGPVVGSGPFVLTEHKPNEFIRFAANKTYWRGAPKYDSLVFVYYKTTDAAAQALAKGEVDLVNRLGPAQFDSLEGAEGVTRNKANGRRFNELVLNSGAATNTGEPIGDGHPALRDLVVRRAIAQAIDRDAIIARVNNGYAQRGTGPIPPVFPAYHLPQPDPDPLPHDPAAANAALDAAGYARGADGTRAKDGRPLRLRLLGHASRAYDEQAAEFVKGGLAAIGVAVDVQIVSDNQLNESATAGTFDLVFSGWGTNPDPDFILSLHTCAQRPGADGKGGTTDTFFCDPEYDALHARQRAEFDQAKRADLVKQMQRRFYEQVPAVVLGYDNVLEAYRSDKFTGFPVQPDPGGVIMAQNGVWGYYGATPAAAGAQRDTGNGTLVVILIVGVAVVVVAGGVLLARRRGAGAEDRE